MAFRVRKLFGTFEKRAPGAFHLYELSKGAFLWGDLDPDHPKGTRLHPHYGGDI